MLFQALGPHTGTIHEPMPNQRVELEFTLLDWILTILTLGIYYLLSQPQSTPVDLRTKNLDHLTDFITSQGRSQREALAIAKAVLKVFPSARIGKKTMHGGSACFTVLHTGGEDVGFKVIKPQRAYPELVGISQERMGGEALALRLSDVPDIAHTIALIVKDQNDHIRVVKKKNLDGPENEGAMVVAALMEYIPGENLMDAQMVRYEHSQLKEIAADLATQLKDIHKKGIIHRDLSMNNIRVDDAHIHHIIDFGSSKEYRKHYRRQSIVVGTKNIVSPEVFLREPQDDKVDTWALGINLFTLYSGRQLALDLAAYKKSGLTLVDFVSQSKGRHNNEMSQILGQLENGSRTDKQFFDLLSKLLESDPKKRLSAAQVLEHPYLQN